ncbi:HNH endonuclease [Actinoplanes sp. SE50]|nr:HNH endonuclease [Actinoplanes sp. SE50]
MCAPERNRTSGLRTRHPALCPLSYKGKVCVREVGFEPTQAMRLLYRQARLSLSSALPRGDRAELNRYLRGHNPALYR